MSIDQLQEYGLERMEDDSIREFLDSQRTGVLGLTADDVPYMVPMSYAYDGDDTIYFTYVLGTPSRKEDLSEQHRRARFLVYSVETMFNWVSVLLKGRLEKTPESEWPDLESMLRGAWRPELFRNASTSGSVRVYEFTITHQAGIRHTGLAPGFREGVEYEASSDDE